MSIQEARDRLQEFATLSDDFDGLGTPVPGEDALWRAGKALRWCQFLKMEPVECSPAPDGGVALLFKIPTLSCEPGSCNYADIELLNNGEIRGAVYGHRKVEVVRFEPWSDEAPEWAQSGGWLNEYLVDRELLSRRMKATYWVQDFSGISLTVFDFLLLIRERIKESQIEPEPPPFID